MYKVINEVNSFLVNMDKSPLNEKVKIQKCGEAKFLRGLAYYNLVSIFGDVPLKETASSTDGISAPRTPKEEVFALIIQDMKDASKVSEKSATGRVNVLAAKAFLGKVYYKMACLDIDTQANWQNAKEMFDDVYNNGPYDLEPEFDKLFGDFVNSSKESIFQLNFSVDSEVCYNRGSNRFAPSQSTTGIAWGTFKATKAAYDLHEGTYPGDPRIEATFMKSWRKRSGNNQKNPIAMVGDELSPNDSTYMYPYIKYNLGYSDADNKIAVEPMMKNGQPVYDAKVKDKQIPMEHVLKMPYNQFPDPKNPSIAVLEEYKLTSGIRNADLAKVFSTETGQENGRILQNYMIRTRWEPPVIRT
ncbi:MAG: RagB/SusD family nutrient uptake outer membrane protein [Bacteroides sp.]|nr:RagB/SusD family nutrient uptake outer membrane protein [Bacteroides sp.]